jgi:hypothetical protein
MRTVRCIGCEPAAMIGGGGEDAIRICSSRRERHQAAHAVAGRANAAGLHVGLCREVVEIRARIGHDVGRRAGGEEFLHQDLALRGIGEHLVRVHRLVRSGAVEQVRQQHEVAMGREPLADLQHGRTNAQAVHEHQNGGPWAARGRAIDVARADPVARLDTDLRHQRFLAQAAVQFPSAAAARGAASLSAPRRASWRPRAGRAGCPHGCRTYDRPDIPSPAPVPDRP